MSAGTSAPAKGTRNSNGEASIYESNGVWHGWVTMGVRPDGSPDRRHRQGKTRKQVVAKVKALEKARDSGTYAVPGGSITLETWLRHWIRNVAPAVLRRKSLASYATDVNRHLIPGLGQHRLARLTATHIEVFYGNKARETKTLADDTTVRRYRPATIDHIHRTLRGALRDAVRAGLIPTNVAVTVRRAQDQSIDAADHAIEPFHIEEARSIIAAAQKRRGGVRFSISLTHGLRQGEALGLPWSKTFLDDPCPYIAVEQQLQRHPWLHGCGGELIDGTWPCKGKRGADCPSRHSGGLVLTKVKSRKGERKLALDPVTVELLREHRTQQEAERRNAGQLWQAHDLVFSHPDGRPIDPRQDSKEWHCLLAEANVREARLHDARHTAATFLLVQGVDARVVMDLMGWSSPSMLGNYQHVIDTLRRDAALKMGSYLHGDNESDETTSPAR